MQLNYICEARFCQLVPGCDFAAWEAGNSCGATRGKKTQEPLVAGVRRWSGLFYDLRLQLHGADAVDLAVDVVNLRPYLDHR